MAKTLTQVLSEQGIELKKSGNLSKAYCPFHKDDTPSFTVYETGTYFCFGCDVWGDAVKFLVEYKGMTAAEALDYVGVDYKQVRAEKSKVIKTQNTVYTWQILANAAHAYFMYLKQFPGPQDYLLRRGLTKETINKYKVGYTDGQVLNLQFAFERQIADETGLMTRNGFETMSHRITIPDFIDEHQTKCDFIMGRTVINDKIKYLGLRMPKPFMGFHEVQKSPVIFVVEGQFDWLTLRQWNYPAICASGTHVQQWQLMPLREKQVVYVPDYDESGAGQTAAEAWKKRLGDRCHILDYSKARNGTEKLDINELALRQNGQEILWEATFDLVWNTPTLRDGQMKWFMNLNRPEELPSTLKPQDSAQLIQESS